MRRERLRDVQVDVGLVLIVGDRRDPSRRTRLVERHAADLAHRIDQIGEILVARRNVLRALTVVELAAVVVGVVVRRGDVQPSGRAEPPDRERQLRRGEEPRFREEHAHTHRRIHLGGDPREVARGDTGRRIRQILVVDAAQVVERAHVVDHHHRVRVTRLEAAQVLRVSLHRARERERVEAVRADPDRSAPAAGAEREHAEEAVEQVLEATGVDHPLELRVIVAERFAREPFADVGERARAILVRDLEPREAALAGGAPRGHRAHADLCTRSDVSLRSSASARAVRSGSWWISAPSEAMSARTIRHGAVPSGPRSSSTGIAPSRA